MKKFKKLLMIMAVSALVGAGFVGCSSGTSEEGGQTQVQEGEAEVDQTVVAVINGQEITAARYKTYLWSAQQVLEQIAGPTIWDMDLEGQSTKEWAKENALESAILAVITEERAEEFGIELTEEEKQFAKENAEGFAEINGEMMALYGFTKSDVEQVLYLADLSAKLQEVISEQYTPVEEDITAFIEENKEAYASVTAKHVLIGKTDEMGQLLPDDQAAERRALATEILNKALAGEDMATLAAEYSEDPGSKDSGGEYTFGRGEMVPEFEMASFDGVAGEVWPELVETAYGYHIIKTEAHHEADETIMREEFVYNERMTFVDTQIREMIAAATVEKTEAYEVIQILRTDVTEESLNDSEETTEEVQE